VEQIRRDFVANISHELRTPLTVILGYLELLQNHPEPQVSQAIERMLGQASQIQALLNDLLELSRLQSDKIHGQEENIDVPGLLMQLKEQGEELSQGRHQLHFEVAKGLRLAGVASDLDSAFSNLLANAIKYTPEGGTISVTWADSPEGPRFSIRDTGIGIPKRDIPRITERFYRVGSDRARKTGGSGLGLAIVKHVLNAHEAVLTIESELGEGSVFTCTFPPSRKREKEEPEARKVKKEK
jgi:two-component system phosphate regulon sensor histidine kinase PhoR